MGIFKKKGGKISKSNPLYILISPFCPCSRDPRSETKCFRSVQEKCLALQKPIALVISQRGKLWNPPSKSSHVFRIHVDLVCHAAYKLRSISNTWNDYSISMEELGEFETCRKSVHSLHFFLKEFGDLKTYEKMSVIGKITETMLTWTICKSTLSMITLFQRLCVTLCRNTTANFRRFSRSTVLYNPLFCNIDKYSLWIHVYVQICTLNLLLRSRQILPIREG